MATETINYIHTKNKQLNSKDRSDLRSCLNKWLNLTETAGYLNCSISTVKKEIDRNKSLYINSRCKNVCGLKLSCTKSNVCGSEKCKHKCAECSIPSKTCNSFCKDFVKEPSCKILKHHCGVCNGCPNLTKCSLNHWYYDERKAQVIHEENLSKGHSGSNFSQKEINDFTIFLKDLVLKNQSLEVIKATNPDKFPYSVQTVYNWIDNGTIKGIDNLMLPRKVRYAKRKNNDTPQKNDYDYLENRLYTDFISYISEHPYDEVVELDSVEGPRHSSYIMTLLFRHSNFMLAYKLPDHTSKSIVNTFKMIRERIGNEIFKNVFKIILTDRGTEFKDPMGIEFDDPTGEKLCSVFYCDARQSQQKGKIERNHSELRKIFPKGFDFNSITQDELNLALSHVNSYPRKMYNYKTPYDIFYASSPSCILELNNIHKVSHNKVNLTPSLIKK